MRIFLLVTICLLTFYGLQAQPVELGDVNWLRSLDDAVKQSKKEGKDILILFQEVPGCATCQNYGNDVLSHPLIVEAIETYFIPLAIYNNHKGEDAMVLQKFGEPSWNNPVVRIVQPDLHTIGQRLAGNYSPSGLTEYMITSLIKRGHQVPAWLDLLSHSLNAQEKGLEEATYSMYCFWAGEKLFGKLDGVYKTEPGFCGNKEVVKVIYDPDQIKKTKLDKIARQNSCRVSSSEDYRMDREPKYYLSKSKYRFVPMTFLQQARINSRLGEGQAVDDLLSPLQQAILKNNNGKHVVHISFLEAWNLNVEKRS